jgi:CRISPR-associated endonuclease Cas1
LRVAVVVNRVDVARRVFERIRKLVKGTAEDGSVEAEVVLLTGRVRPLHRDRIINRLRDLKLFAEPKRGDPPKPIILVATQTIEAGADLDVDALVTEIAPLDCLRQRFGRLDRLGERRESKAAILSHKKSSKEWKSIEKVYGQAARATADWLDAVKDKKGGIDFGIEAFEPILQKFTAAESEPKIEDLIARRADAPVLLPVYADLWATTSPAPSATPEPALFLHGPSIAADVQIVWRADIDLDDVAAANISLDLCPPASLEALPVPIWAAQRWLDARDSAPFADVVERAPEEDHERGEPNCLRYDRDLPEGECWSKVESSVLRPGDRIVVPCRSGGCDEWGWNPDSKDEVVDLGAEANYLQRLKGALRVTRATLANALHRERRQAEAAGICLPDEVSFFRRGLAPRPLNPSADTALPLYVQEPGARVTKSGEVLVVEAEDKKTQVAIGEISELVLHGPISLTTPALGALLREEIPVTYASTGGWVLGHTVSTGHRNVAIRIAQSRAAFDERRSLAFARSLVTAKIRNCRVFLRRNFKAGDEAERDATLEALTRLADRAAYALTEEELLGFEGEAAARYFRLFSTMLGVAARDFPEFGFDKRTRRPPADPINAMLSFAYSLLTRTWLTVLSAIGFDPYLGFYHRPRFGRPALALDMMEPFRPILADSTVIQAVNNGEVKPDGFLAAGTAVSLKPNARRAFIAAYERRLDQEVTHPVFGYRVSMRRLLAVQARLLTRHLAGEIDDYPHYLVR